MNIQNNQPESMLDRALREIREEPVDPKAIEDAAERVWRSVSAETAPAAKPQAVEHIRTCADYQALLPDYKAGTLSSARATLVTDHLHECVHCRRIYEGRVVAMPAIPHVTPPASKSASRRNAWMAAAAAVAVFVGVGGYLVLAPSAAGARVTVQSIEGKLYRVGPGNAELKAGEEVPGGTEIRTAQNSGAMVRLSDGSVVEMREQSGLAVSATGRDLTVKLSGGAVMVQAAKDRSRHVYVSTRDARVSVTGTVFSVNSGVKGSRVSVVEGEVRVRPDGAAEKVLRPGDQMTTNSRVGAVPVEEEIAWSRNYSQHLALLREFAVLGKRIDSEVRMPGLRYSSRLLSRLPADTVIVAALPNLGEALSQAHDIFRQRVAESPVLKQWWDGVDQKRGGGAGIEEVIATMRTVSEYLGDEIVMGVSMDASGRLMEPVLLAEAKRPGLEQFAGANLKGSPLRMLVRSGVVAVSPGDNALRSLETGGGFAGTSLYKRVGDSYKDGVGFLLSADLEKLVARRQQPHGPSAVRAVLPLDQLSSVVVEQKEISGQGSGLRASVAFSGKRSGIASWLGAPASMGVLDYFSPDAQFATSFVIQNPAQILEELLAAGAAEDPKFSQHLAEVEAKLGLSIRNDLAAPLGTQIAVAADGPLFPNLSWKVIAEVYDPGRLQWSIQKLVDAFNRETSGKGVTAVTLSQSAANGRVYYTLSTTHPQSGTPVEAHYTFTDGYLVAAATQALVDSSLQQRASGFSLPRSSGFLSLVPRDRNTGFSGMIYSNVGGAMAAVLERLSPEQRGVAGVAGDMKPTLITLYADQDRVTLASSGGLLGLTLNQILSMNGPGGLFRRGTSEARSAYRK